MAKARETLTRAIHLVENTPEWNAKVVYGDTDRLIQYQLKISYYKIVIRLS